MYVVKHSNVNSKFTKHQLQQICFMGVSSETKTCITATHISTQTQS